MSSSSGNRASYHHGSLREALVDGARQLLVETGEAGFSLNNLARRLGVSTAAPYRHFADRDALLAAVADGGYAQLDTALRTAAGESDGPADQLLLMGLAYLSFATENPAIFGIMFRPGPDGVKESNTKPFQVLVDVVESAQFAGALRDDVPPRILARTIWATVHGLSCIVLAGGLAHLELDDTPRRLAMDTLRTFLREERAS
ncbi:MULTISPECIES: TetR/AcrR family transcriptional regulator [Polymorphospora]|uniref:TetR/AcrR family transcriptional regulator n=1 Tax=Polymorphospora lycopeni TaxID=3140240 RepID=A0ABV5CL63_9ACTN